VLELVEQKICGFFKSRHGRNPPACPLAKASFRV